MTYWTGASSTYLGTEAADAWREDAQRAGRSGTQRILSAGEVASPYRELGEVAVLRRRLILLDGVPVEIAESYWPVEVAAGTDLAESKRVAGGTNHYLAGIGYEPSRVDEFVQASRACASEARELGVEPGDPVLVLTRETRRADGLLYEVSRMVTSAGVTRLHYSMRVD